MLSDNRGRSVSDGAVIQYQGVDHVRCADRYERDPHSVAAGVVAVSVASREMVSALLSRGKCVTITNLLAIGSQRLHNAE